MILFSSILFFVCAVNAERAHAGTAPATETLKDQFCTDPRTMRKHAAYSEWADAYSCTRHRCQPGGRNLAIYTVGCKRVEAPESAIECEEVVEDTNMQFPFCCTRLRCLVVVRGEVWTRVLGQPWETLPAAPWSHMYKMKKPPPSDGGFVAKTGDGPVYELSSDNENDGRDKVLRSGKKVTTSAPDCNHAEARTVPTPDIVIALSTDGKERKKDGSRHSYKRVRKTTPNNPYLEEIVSQNDLELTEVEEPALTDKPAELTSDEKFFSNSFGVTKKPPSKSKINEESWTEIPPTQWHEASMDIEKRDATNNFHQSDILSQMTQEQDKKDEKPSNLQALVDAIGTRMRDIENVVQKMSEKVHQKPGEQDVSSIEKRTLSDNEVTLQHHISETKDHGMEKKPQNDDQFKRFSIRSHGSQYLNGVTEGNTDVPLLEDSYFSDASNTMERRSGQVINPPKEPPAETYMAPVDTRRKSHNAVATSEEVEKKHKKRVHKKKKAKGRGHKKRKGKEEKKKRAKPNSVESVKSVNEGSPEDSSALV